MKFSRRLIIISLSLAAVLPVSAMAQTFPSKPVRIILPFPTGTGPDNVMRQVGNKLSTWWGVPVLIDNRTGGNGWIAVDAAKKAPADGYTFIQMDPSQLALQPHLYKTLPFDPVNDFVAVAPMYSTNYFVVVAADSKYNSIPDLIAGAKAAKGQMTYGSSGVGGNLHLFGEMFASAVGAPMTHIPIKQTVEIYTSISRGDIAWAFGTGSTVGPLYQAKKVKYLALAAPKRHPSYPDIPTLREAGGPPDLEARTWVGLFAAAGTPKAIIDRVNSDVSRAMAEPDVRDRLEAVGFSAWPAPAAHLSKALEDDRKLFGEVVRKVKVSLD